MTERTPGMSPPSRNLVPGIAWLLLAILIAIHVLLTFKLFPSWKDFVNDEPVISVDHAIHLYHGFLGATFLKEHGTSWGYDPFFMAGYPKTPVYDSSSGPAELFELLAGGGYSPRAYKIGIACLVGLIPAIIGLAVWAYEARPASIAASVACCVWFWWIGYFDVLVRTGLVAFVWSSALAMLLPALLVRWRRPSTAKWFALCLTAAAGIQAHSMFPLMVFAPLAFGYVWLSVRRLDESWHYERRRNWRWHVATWAALAAALAVTSFWWWPLLRFLSLKTSSELFMKFQGNPLDPAWRRIVGSILEYYLLTDAQIPILLLLMGLVGLARKWSDGRRLETCMLGVQIVVLLLLTLCGSEWRVTRNLEPLRFQVPLGLAWCVAGGEGLTGVFAALAPRRLLGPNSDRLCWFSAASLAGVAILVTFPSVWWTRVGLNPNLRPSSIWRSTLMQLQAAEPLAVGLRPEMDELVSWIRANTDGSARILFEDQLRLLENRNPSAPESLHWTPLLPLLTGRQFVGGLYEAAFIPHQHVAFGDWHLAGRHIRKWTPEQIREFCEQYNIGWIVTWSRASVRKLHQVGEDPTLPLSTEVFASLDFCENVAVLPRCTVHQDENEYAVFRVRREPNFCAYGSARVESVDFNRITLADLEPDGGEIVLRFHWQDSLISEPHVPIERAAVPGDPVGFIRIKTDRTFSKLTILNGY